MTMGGVPFLNEHIHPFGLAAMALAAAGGRDLAPAVSGSPKAGTCRGAFLTFPRRCGIKILIVLGWRAVDPSEMLCDRPRLWTARLLGMGALLCAVSSLAEKPTSPGSANEWHSGTMLRPTRSESYRLSAGTSITLLANAVVEVEPRVKLPRGIDGLGPSAYAAQLTSGRIDISINPKQRPASAVFIYGPRRTTLLAVTGRVSVVAGPSSVSVGVYEGKNAASIGMGSTWRHISAGSSFSVSSHAPQGILSKLPAAPTHVRVNCPALAIDGGDADSRASWDPVPGAQRYVVELVNVETKAHQSFETRETFLALRGLDAGRHELSVSAIDATGLDGEASSHISVNVVGLKLPPGAFISKGRVFLEPYQRVSLTYVDGLQATYDNAHIYVRAPKHAGLWGTRATTMHLRLPGATERVSLEFLPRNFHTQVDILPALARWPRDKVVVRIQLPPSPPGALPIEVTPTVTVNSRSVDVEWIRTEQSLRAVLAEPPSYPGPWVVRAKVVDQHGITLGRNFLEVASTVGLDDEELPREVRLVAPHKRTAR